MHIFTYNYLWYLCTVLLQYSNSLITKNYFCIFSRSYHMNPCINYFFPTFISDFCTVKLSVLSTNNSDSLTSVCRCVCVYRTFFKACEWYLCFVQRVCEGRYVDFRSQASSVVLYQGFQSSEVLLSPSCLLLMAHIKKD